MLRGGVRVLVWITSVCLAGAAIAQNPTASDARARDLANRSMLAMTGGVKIADATLQAQVTSFAGGQPENATGRLVAKGTSESRIDIALTRTVIRNDTGAFPQGAATDAKGNFAPSALHNCWVTPSWFFPALSYLAQANDPTLIFTYIGPETRNGLSVEHLRISRHLANQSARATGWIEKFSATDVYLSSVSLLPVAFAFNTHPDGDASTDTATDIEFADYQIVNGVQVPLHIQKIVERKLVLDVAVNSAVFGSGVSDALFPVQ